uniref:Uncharacterized protein n=1 Tax=Aegilops tauschii TaxID=37682 RepID=M8BGW4_AEGTA
MSLSFLTPDEYWYVDQLDTCNGLLLCGAHMFPSSPSGDKNTPVESHYIVCNPATGRWVDLPPHPEVPPGGRIFARLSFDPAVSSHFHVLQFKNSQQKEYVIGVNIYSSQTGHGFVEKATWLRKLACSLASQVSSFTDDAVLVAVDMEGQVWNTIRVPSGGLSFGRTGLSKGCLHYATTPLATDDKKKKKRKKKKEDTSTVWCMKDYDSKEWVLKHSVSNDELWNITGVDYKVAAFHPDRDTIFWIHMMLIHWLFVPSEDAASHPNTFVELCDIQKKKDVDNGTILVIMLIDIISILGRFLVIPLIVMMPSDLENNIKAFISSQKVFNAMVEEKLLKIDDLARNMDRISLEIDSLKIRSIPPNHDINNSLKAMIISIDECK